MIRKFLKNRLAYTSDLNKLIEAINKKFKITVRGNGVRTTSGPNGMQVTINPATEKSPVRVKTQEAWQTDGTISVKRLNSSGEETGQAFDVYWLRGKSNPGTTDGYWPLSLDEDGGVNIWIAKDEEGDWTMISPSIMTNPPIYDVRYDDTSHKIQSKKMDDTSTWIDEITYTSIAVGTGLTIDGVENQLELDRSLVFVIENDGSTDDATVDTTDC